MRRCWKSQMPCIDRQVENFTFRSPWALLRQRWRITYEDEFQKTNGSYATHEFMFARPRLRYAMWLSSSAINQDGVTNRHLSASHSSMMAAILIRSDNASLPTACPGPSE